MRMTRKDCQRFFELLCKAMGKRVATSHNDIGAWSLDYAECYGGFVIEEIVSSGGGVTHPMGSRRRGIQDFFKTLDFALDVLHIMKGESK